MGVDSFLFDRVFQPITDRLPEGVSCFDVARQTALVPQLHRHADEVIALIAQQGRDGGGIDSSRHGYGNGRLLLHTSSKTLTAKVAKDR